MRIARKLHNTPAHGTSVIAVQAGVGHHATARHPADAAKALAPTETTSRATLRMLLGLLREEVPPSPEAGFAPAPGLTRLDALATRTKRAGLRVDLHIEEEPRGLPRGVDLAAYRILQEALTTVVKHAAMDSVPSTMRKTRRPRRSRNRSRPGHGLTGMRERSALYGGQFAAAPLPMGGFRTSTRIPTSDLPCFTTLGAP